MDWGRPSRYRVVVAVSRKPVTVVLDGELLDRARARAGSASKPDSEVVEDALAVYLGKVALDEAQAESDLPEEEASRIAYEELDAMRRERDAAG